MGIGVATPSPRAATGWSWSTPPTARCAAAREQIARTRGCAAMFSTARPAHDDHVLDAHHLHDRRSAALADAGYVVENVTEKPAVKERLYRELDAGLCGRDCVVRA